MSMIESDFVPNHGVTLLRICGHGSHESEDASQRTIFKPLLSEFIQQTAEDQ